MKKKVLIGVGAFLGVVLIVIAVVIVLATRPLPEQPQSVSSNAQTQGGLTTYDTLADIKKQAETAQRSGTSGALTFIITEDEANSNMAKLVGAQPIPGMTMKDAHMYFREGYAESIVKTEVRGVPMDINMKYTMQIVNGEPVVNVQSVSAGLLPVPFSKEQISKSLSGFLAKVLKDNGLSPNNPTIQITTGKMTVTAGTGK
jgi:hypothetical protein